MKSKGKTKRKNFAVAATATMAWLIRRHCQAFQQETERQRETETDMKPIEMKAMHRSVQEIKTKATKTKPKTKAKTMQMGTLRKVTQPIDGREPTRQNQKKK